MPQDLYTLDCHCHHVPASAGSNIRLAPPHADATLLRTSRALTCEAALVSAIESGDIAGRVVSTPSAHVADEHGWLCIDTSRIVNDALAQLTVRHFGRVFALASINAFDGERGAREAERAILQLGLKGLFVDAASDHRLLDAPEARPTLEVANRLQVPLFIHPINPQPMSRQMAPYGRVGTLFARGTVTAQALLALVETKVFEQLSNLQIIVPALAWGGLAIAAEFGERSQAAGGALTTLRGHLTIDTMGFSGPLIRAAADLLGPDHILCGSDWPILSEGAITTKLSAALVQAGLGNRETALIASGNARRIFAIG